VSCTLSIPAAQAGNVILGVYTVGVDRMNEQQQDAFVEQRRENGVKLVRLGLGVRLTDAASAASSMQQESNS
jgi:hypothetical protein